MESDGVVCGVCSLQNPSGANFCSACGARLPEPEGDATGAYPVIGVGQAVSSGSY